MLQSYWLYMFFWSEGCLGNPDGTFSQSKHHTHIWESVAPRSPPTKGQIKTNWYTTFRGRRLRAPRSPWVDPQGHPRAPRWQLLQQFISINTEALQLVPIFPSQKESSCHGHRQKGLGVNKSDVLHSPTIEACMVWGLAPVKPHQTCYLTLWIFHSFQRHFTI